MSILNWCFKNAGKLGVTGVMTFCVWFIDLKTETLHAKDVEIESRLDREKVAMLALVAANSEVSRVRYESLTRVQNESMKMIRVMDKRIFEMHKRRRSP